VTRGYCLLVSRLNLKDKKISAQVGTLQEEAAKKAKEEAAKRARENAKKHQGPKKYIQVASVTTEASARGIAKRLGGNFYYKKTTDKKSQIVISSEKKTVFNNFIKKTVLHNLFF